MSYAKASATVEGELILSSSSVNETLEHDAATLAPLAKKLGFSFEAFGSLHGNKTERHITLAASGESALEPAPISPAESKAFELMAATARHIFGAKIVTSPTGMYGEYWHHAGSLLR